MAGECALDRMVLLLYILAQHRDRYSAYRTGEVRARPQPLRMPIVAHELGNSSRSRRDETRAGVRELRQRDFGWEVDQQVDVIGFAVELDQFAFEVLTDRPHGLLHPCQVPVVEDPMPIFW